MNSRVRIPLVLVGLLVLLTGCGVDTLAGVTLAPPTVTVDSTPQVTPTPSIELTQTLEKAFTDTAITLNYPLGWQVDEGSQYTVLTGTVYPEAENGIPSITFYIGLVGSLQLEDSAADERAPLVLTAYGHMIAQGNYIPQDVAFTLEDIHGFEWGGHAAAIFPWHSNDADVSGVFLVVLDESARRFVFAAPNAPAALWPEVEPVMLAMLGTLTLDGASLPSGDLSNAYAAAAAS